MKTIIVFSIMIFLQSIIEEFYGNTHQNIEYIEWKANRKLIFEDFQGVVDSSSTEAAMCNYKVDFKYERVDNFVNFKISALFLKNGSWIKLKTPKVLNHEQGHFDIAEIFSRKIKQAIFKTKFDISKFESEVFDLNKKFIDSCDYLQYLYDLETSHSIDSASQLIWDTKISDQLLLLKSFEKIKEININLEQ